MNVLMLAPELLPAWGGVGVYISEIAKNFPNDVEVHILTPLRTHFSDTIINDLQQQNIKFPSNVFIHHVGTAKDNFFYNLSFQLNCLRIVPRFIKEYNIDILHSQSAMPDLFISPQKIKIPIVTTIHTTIEGQLNAIMNTSQKFHDLDSSEKMTKFFGPFLKKIENSYYKNNRYFITVSNWGKSALIAEKGIPHEKIRVIHNGVDAETFSPKSKIDKENVFQELLDINALKVLYLSRFINYKGINYLIDSIPKILKKIDAFFIFAGAGKINIKNLRENNYRYIGYVKTEEKPYLYNLSDIFILPSFYENFPISILESMASENAVIASNVGGIPEMITSNYNGLLIPPKDTESIARAIINLGEDSFLRKKLSKNARASVMEKFNWKIAALQTKHYYEEILQI